MPASLHKAEIRQKAFDHLAAADPLLARALATVGQPGWREQDPGFAGLARMVAFQQLSVKAAATIWSRVRDKLQIIEPTRIAQASEEDLRSCGLSRPKIGHIKSIAAAVSSDALNFERLASQDNETAFADLVAIKGIGPWTARLYLMFCEGRPDFFPDNDLGLQEAYRLLCETDVRPDAKTMSQIAEKWSPFRTAAAMLLWSYVNHRRDRDSNPG